MKVTLTEITTQMVANPEELVKAIMENFNAINNMAELREGLIIDRLSQMQASIKDLKTGIKEFKDELKSDISGVKTNISGVKNDVLLLSQNMDKLMRNFDVEPDREILIG